MDGNKKQNKKDDQNDKEIAKRMNEQGKSKESHTTRETGNHASEAGSREKRAER